MPTMITRGAASAKAFGFTNASGGAGYKYLILGGSAQIYSVNTPNLQTTGTLISTNYLNQEAYEFPAIVAKGNFIATNNYYSNDNGVTWTLYKQNFGSSVIQSKAIGVDGGFSINPTTKNIVSLSPRLDYAKGGSFMYIKGYNGISITSATVGFNTGYQPRNIVYCSALGGFYVSLLQGQTWFIYENILNVPYGVNSTGSSSAYYPYANKDGYYVAPFFNGSSWAYRTYNSQDLSTYSSTTVIQGSQRPYNTVPVWHPATQKYYMAGYSTAGGTSLIFFQQSTDGANFSLITSFSTATTGYNRLSFNFTSDTDFVIQGYGFFASKSGYVQSPVSYYSSDAGVNWSNAGNPQLGAWVASCKNLTLI